MGAPGEREAGPRYRGLPLKPRRRASSTVRALLLLVAVGAVLVVLPSLLELPDLSLGGNEAEQLEWDLQRISAGFSAYADRVPPSQRGRLEGVNPMVYAGLALNHYAGEVGPGDRRPEPGHWYFDTRLRHLVYRVRDREQITSLGPIAGELHFHIARAGLGSELHGFRSERDAVPVLRPRYRYRVRRE